MKLTGHDLSLLKPIAVQNGEGLARASFTGVSTDSRTVREGELFVALRGENFDGHRFLGDALARGARAAVVESIPEVARETSVPLVVVPDALQALGELAALYRGRFAVPVLAVGGSNGKTTTKEMIAAVLRKKYRVLSTEGNLNNQIGVPHTLFRLKPSHEVAVVEIGTNHPGEIAYLCGIVRPTHGVVTNVGREHLEFFTSLEGVSKEEGALFAYLAADPASLAIVNADDPLVRAAAKRVRKKFLYGFTHPRVQLKGSGLHLDGNGYASFSFALAGGRRSAVELGVPGEHNARNALAAAAVGAAFRVPARETRKALGGFRAVGKRMEVLTLNGVTILNDTYNANPDSVLAALQTLARTAVSGKRIAVLGEMRELGDRAREEHAAIGAAASRYAVDYLLTVGECARYISENAQGMFAAHYEQKNVLAEYLAELLAPGDAVLLKGSRAMKMEDIVLFLLNREVGRGRA